ncbi:hypothetical protein [Streptomyces anandii]|uniref:hypothetical protein n=1 Tax=Streptomyces anandii TaxID=285454 RepID=UPI0037AC9F94
MDNHDGVGLETAAEPGPALAIHTAEPGSASEEGPRPPAFSAATQEADEARRAGTPTPRSAGG